MTFEWGLLKFIPYKEIYSWYKNRNIYTEISPIILNSSDLSPLIADGKLSGKADDYRFVRPENVFSLTENNNSNYLIAWVESKKSKTKRKIIRQNSAGQEDLILLKKK